MLRPTETRVNRSAGQPDGPVREQEKGSGVFLGTIPRRVGGGALTSPPSSINSRESKTNLSQQHSKRESLSILTVFLPGLCKYTRPEERMRRRRSFDHTSQLSQNMRATMHIRSRSALKFFGVFAAVGCLILGTNLASAGDKDDAPLKRALEHFVSLEDGPPGRKPD